MKAKTLTVEEREQIYIGKCSGQTLKEIAEALKISYTCARKWWRQGRDQGLAGLQGRPPGRPARAALATFAPEVVQASLTLKRQHPRWGANRVLIELGKLTVDTGLKLPSYSRLYVLFKQHCPDCLKIWTRHKTVPRPPAATAVHQIWQVDHQEGHRLADQTIATVCNIRDPYGAAIIASQAFSVQTPRRWRKLTWEEVRAVLRIAFDAWQTLPVTVQTDNEMSLGANPTDPFPSFLSLWLSGLGIRHTFIRPHCPKDQPQIERQHRTLDGLTADVLSRVDLHHFQHALDNERTVYNQQFPSRASDCRGRPPLQAHPALLSPARPFVPGSEAVLFDLQRVYNFLGTFVFTRKVNSNGQVTLKGIHYTVGLSYAGQYLQVQLDPQQQAWIFSKPDPLGQLQEVRRQPLVGLTFIALTGLPLDPLLTHPVQLNLPLAF